MRSPVPWTRVLARGLKRPLFGPRNRLARRTGRPTRRRRGASCGAFRARCRWPLAKARSRRDAFGRVGVRDVYNAADRRAAVDAARRSLRSYDVLRRGALREAELEKYVAALTQRMPLAKTMDSKFHAFYVFTAVRRFMFLLDAQRRGRIAVSVLANSTLCLELHAVTELETAPARGHALFSSWFLPHNAKQVYSDYLELDADHNGMVSPAELLRFRGARRGARLTPAFVGRVFAESVTYSNEASGEGEMDFKTYLDLALAFENVDATPAVRYFWRLLDVGEKGRIDAFAIAFFFRDVAAAIQDEGYDAPCVADVVDEIFDMVKPQNAAFITVDDLLKCKVARTVITMLVDVAGFLAYDNREHLAHAPEDDDF